MSCASGDSTNPCVVKDVDSFHGFGETNIMYLATTTQIWTTTANNHKEGIITYPSASTSQTNGGSTSAIVVTSQKNSGQGDQSAAKSSSHYTSGFAGMTMFASLSAFEDFSGGTQVTAVSSESAMQMAAANFFYSSIDGQDNQLVQWTSSSTDTTALNNACSITFDNSGDAWNHSSGLMGTTYG